MAKTSTSTGRPRTPKSRGGSITTEMAADRPQGQSSQGDTGAGHVATMEPFGEGTERDAGAEGDKIARRAYEIYERRGRQDGRDFDDWLEAEQELRGGRGGTR
jgi:hypothetical protein